MKKDWNELEFTNLNDFKRMAPSIIQLEISRLGKIIGSLEATNSVHNLLVKARYDLTEFQKDVETLNENKVNNRHLSKLYSALFCIASASKNSGKTIEDKINYVSDRLNDLLNKCKMIY
jgi:hypothetical protein